jgi:hypothetical protein
MKQSARAVLLWSLGLYGLSAVVFCVIIDQWCPNVTEKEYRGKWEQLQQLVRETPKQPLVVMLGSSRSDAAFQASRLDGLLGPDDQPLHAFNFGIAAAGPLHEQLYLRDMLEHGIRPRLLLIEFLPPLLSRPQRGLISEEKWTSAAWLSASQLLRLSPYLGDPQGKVSDWIEARVAPWYVHRAALHEWAQVELLHQTPPTEFRRTSDRWGWGFGDGLTREDMERFRAVSRLYIPSLGGFRLGRGPTRAMRDLLACCRHEHIPVVLVVTPESTEFRTWYSAACQAQTDRLLAELCATYGAKAIDARRWLADEDFADGHHARKSGATLFTTRLLAELQQILKKG